jgi:NAD(P)H-flavin reductase
MSHKRDFANYTDPMVPRLFKVAKRWRETPNTWSLLIASLDSEEKLSFAPGQFNMLYAFGTGEIPISISGEPGKTKSFMHTIHAIGPVSKALCKLQRGEMLGVRGPFGSPWPLEKAQGNDIILAAAGCGLAPLRAALLHLLSQRSLYGKIILLYGARSPQDLLYKKELDLWRQHLKVLVTVSSATGEWKGRVGHMTMFIPNVRFDPTRATAFICGPEMMIRATARELLGRGMSTGDIFVSIERNMKCGIGLCGHCQIGPFFVCKDGPVFAYDILREWLEKREV